MSLVAPHGALSVKPLLLTDLVMLGIGHIGHTPLEAFMQPAD